LNLPMTNAQALDVIAACVFLLCWLGYGRLARHIAKTRPSMMSAVRTFRHRWMERMCERDNHVADAALLSNLLRGALFFASTTVFILGGLVALLGTAPKVAEVVAGLPFTSAPDKSLAEIKALVLILLYIYAFFKFTWSAWQYNVLSIMVGAMPAVDAEDGPRNNYREAGARVVSLAGESYNHGIRAYYFSIPLMAWFVDSWIFLAATIAITIVLYRRDFHSPVLVALKDVQS
jgi:uncharacterized membrane protein